MDYSTSIPAVGKLSTSVPTTTVVNNDDETLSISHDTGTVTITYQCEPFEQLKILQMRSDGVETRAMCWRLMLTSKMNNNSKSKSSHNENDDDDPFSVVDDFNNRHLSVYVQCDPVDECKFWHCYAKCKITLISANGPSKTITKEFRNNFTKKDNDFGYSEYISFAKLLDTSNGFVGRSAEGNNYITIVADIVTEYPYGIDWDSRSNTNHVGLLNLGATCYMNSLLQTFYFTNQLRLATYNTPTYMDDSDNSIMYALQYIFYQLQFNQTAVDTSRLTQAFGWTQADSFQQHDVQEFCRILLESMENSMKGTAAEKIIAKLLEGKQMSFINCVNVDYQSERVESVYDIQLKVKGLRNVYESFDDYIQIEQLDGENKYAAEGYGYQDANKGVIFTHLPPVLHLHLMRFTFDMKSLDFIKIKDRYEFPDELNLDPYLHKDHVDSDDPAIYSLGAVLVHIGGINSGHYVVYINPSDHCSSDGGGGGGGQWLKFDDDLVVKVNRNEAMEDNFGGSGNNVFKPGTTAYMLVYIRNSARDHVFKGISCQDIPTSLVERITRDISKEKIQRYKNDHYKEIINVQLYLEDCFYVTQSKGLACGGGDGFHFEFFQSYTFQNAFNYMCTQLKIHPDCCRVWLFAEDEDIGAASTAHNNNNLGLPKFFANEFYSSTLKDLTCYTKQLTLYLDIVKPDIISMRNICTPISSSDCLAIDTNINITPVAAADVNANDNAMIFIKSFHTLSAQLSYIGHVCVDINQTWNDILELVLEKCEIYSNNNNNNIDNGMRDTTNQYRSSSVTLFIEDIGEIPVQILDRDSEISRVVEKDQSCILCVQENFNAPPSVIITDFSQFIFQKNNNFDVKFTDKKYPVANERKFSVSCSPNSKYADLMKIVQSHLVHPQEQIQLYYSPSRNIDLSSLQLLNATNPITIFDIAKKSKSYLHYANNHNEQQRVCTIFYECLDINVSQLVLNVRFNLKFIPSVPSANGDADADGGEQLDKFTAPFHLPLLLPKTSTITELIQCANTYLSTDINYPLVNSVRILEVVSSKVVCLLSDDISVTRIVPSIEKTLLVEEIPNDQLPSALTSRDRLVNCCFSRNKNFRQFFGVPFLLKISLGMTFKDIYDQIKSKLQCYPSEFLNKCSLFIVRTQQVDPFPQLDDIPNMMNEFPYERLFPKHFNHSNVTGDDSSNYDTSRAFTSAAVIGISIATSDTSPAYIAAVSNKNYAALRIPK